MPTPNSSAASYATVTQLLQYHDQRQIADLVKDNDTRETGVATNAYVLAALKRASGELEMACTMGKRYTPADLNAINGVSREALIGLVCDLAYWHLVKRRHPGATLENVPGALTAYGILGQLRKGELVFGLLEQQEAALMETITRVPNDEEDRRRTVTQAMRFFGHRSWR